MNKELQRDLMAALERSHRLGTIGGDLQKQLAHCASFSAVLAQVHAVAPITRALDLGTGGGLPGIALAAMWPSTEWTLVDMRAARIDEVERTILRLGLHDRVGVRAIEAQRLAHETTHRFSYDVVVARSFGQTSLAAECATALLRQGGSFVISEPPSATESGSDTDQRWDEQSLERLGFGPPEFRVANSSRFAVLVKLGQTPESAPRLPPRPNRGWF